jgi:hypothetical protein
VVPKGKGSFLIMGIKDPDIEHVHLTPEGISLPGIWKIWYIDLSRHKRHRISRENDE